MRIREQLFEAGSLTLFCSLIFHTKIPFFNTGTRRSNIGEIKLKARHVSC